MPADVEIPAEHSCDSCMGIDPDSCLFSPPSSTPPAVPDQPAEVDEALGNARADRLMLWGMLKAARAYTDRAESERDAARATAVSLEAERVALREWLLDEIDEIEPGCTPDDGDENTNTDYAWAKGYRAAMTLVGKRMDEHPHERAEGEPGE